MINSTFLTQLIDVTREHMLPLFTFFGELKPNWLAKSRFLPLTSYVGLLFSLYKFGQIVKVSIYNKF